MRRSRSTTRSRVGSRPWATWLPTSPRSFGRELRTDGREGGLQRDDVAGRVHRAREAYGRPRWTALDGAVDGTAAVDIPAAVLPGEPEARRGRRRRARQRHRPGDV